MNCKFCANHMRKEMNVEVKSLQIWGSIIKGTILQQIVDTNLATPVLPFPFFLRGIGLTNNHGRQGTHMVIISEILI